MIKKDANNNLSGFSATNSDSDDLSNASDDFRETLIKSGIDVAAFQTKEEIGDDFSEKFPTVYSVDFAETENEFVKKQTAQNILESPEKAKKMPKFRRWQHLTAIGGIAAIIVLQSVFQFSFIQGENQRLAEDLAESALPTEQKIEKNTTVENLQTNVAESEQNPKFEEKIPFKKSDAKNLIQSKKNAPRIQNEIREAPAKTVSRQKEQRESTAQRIRRAEKILTGV